MERQMHEVEIDITVLLGRTNMPVQQLLRMGRGAMIALNSRHDDEVWVLGNDYPIARGSLSTEGEKIMASITDPANIRDYYAGK